MRYATLTIAGIALAAVAFLLSTWDRFLNAMLEPAGQSAVPVIVTVKPTETLADLLPRLAERGLLRNVDTVRTYLDWFHDPHPLTPGEYSLSQAMGPAEVIAHLEAGRRVKRPVNIPEGTTIEVAAGLLDEAGIVDADVFLRATKDSEVLSRMGISAPSAEGLLLPDVYSFARGAEAESVLGTMIGAFERSYAQAIGDRTNGLTRAEVVTLASLLEKAPVPRKERRLFSALLRNRMRAQIPLHSEATRAYAAELPEEDQPAWDTFSKPGLPPGPICSPGTSALLAAANPATSRALYAVTRTDGTHVYCDDLDCLYEESRRYRRPLPRPLPLPIRQRRRSSPPPPRAEPPPPPPRAEPPPSPGRAPVPPPAAPPRQSPPPAAAPPPAKAPASPPKVVAPPAPASPPTESAPPVKRLAAPKPAPDTDTESAPSPPSSAAPPAPPAASPPSSAAPPPPPPASPPPPPPASPPPPALEPAPVPEDEDADSPPPGS